MKRMRPSTPTWLVPIIVAVLLAVLWVVPYSGQTNPPLFLDIMPSPSGDPPLGIAAIFPVVLNFDDLPHAPPALEIELPTGETFVADLVTFERIAGFDETTGDPLPDATIDDLSYGWIGKGGGNDVILAVCEGAMSGIIDGLSGQFEISGAFGDDVLLALAPHELPPEEADAAPPPVVGGVPFVSGSGVVPAAFAAAPRTPMNLFAGGGPRITAYEPRPVISVLVLYTELARVQAGGTPDDPSDNRDIRSQIYAAIHCANVAFANSEIEAIVGVAQILPFDEVQPSGVGFDDLTDLQTNPSAQSLRDQFNADVVSLIFPDLSTEVKGCGFAFVQRPDCGDYAPIPGCNMGNAFEPFAYNWVSRQCMNAGRYSFLHELSHLLGAEHDEQNGVPRDRASFFFAFAHFIDNRRRTVMAQDIFGLTTRALHVSNPDVLYEGSPTGVAGLSNNAEALRLLIPFVAGFRGPDTFVFGDGCERGDTLLWSDVEP